MSKPVLRENFVAIVAVHVVENGKLLLIEETERKGGGWYLPAGRVDAGESLEAAAIRETKEEAGVDVAIKGIAVVEWYSHASSLWARFTFVAERVSGEPKRPEQADGESVQASFFPLEKVPSLDLRAPDVLELLAPCAASIERNLLAPASDDATLTTEAAELVVIASMPNKQVFARNHRLPRFELKMQFGASIPRPVVQLGTLHVVAVVYAHETCGTVLYVGIDVEDAGLAVAAFGEDVEVMPWASITHQTPAEDELLASHGAAYLRL